MKTGLKSQRGYLIIILIAIIIILAFVGVILAHMFTTSTTSATNVLQADRAFYIAASGLEKAKRDIIVNGLNCDNTAAGLTPANYTNQALFDGQYTIVANSNLAWSTLSGNINTTQTNITLTNASQFSSPSGLISIDTEIIYYPSINIGTNTLQNVLRGAAGTAVTIHNSGADVFQNQCLLTGTAGTPTIADPEGKRILLQLLNGTPFSFTDPTTGRKVTPTTIQVGGASLNGNAAIKNPYITAQSSTFIGSTILGGAVSYAGPNAGTWVNSDSGLVLSSNRDNAPGDILPSPAITASNLFQLLFNTTKTAMQSSANQTLGSTNLAGINGLAGPIVWINGSLTDAGTNTATLGSPANPVLLVVNGSIDLKGQANLTVYGLVYVTGDAKLTGGENPRIISTVVTEGSMELTGNASIQYGGSNLPIPGTRRGYTSTVVSQEMYQ